ncbi:MAG: beta strand repeat-containing protein [Planctomycetota bacterium]
MDSTTNMSRPSGRRVAALFAVAVLFTLRGFVAAQSTAGFDFDLNGNRTAASSQIRFTSVGGFSFEPNRAVPGDRINIYGRNFPIAAPSLYSVSFAGGLGTVVSVAERVIAVDIPITAAQGDVVLTLPDGTQITLGTLYLQGLIITPPVVDLAYGGMQQFSAQIFGAPGGTITWAVESITAGASAGSISASGLYTAPSAATGAFPVLVKATSPDLGQTAYALVRGLCASTAPIGYSTLTAGSFSAGFERDCYEFTANAGQLISASYFGTPSARRFRVLNNAGYPLAVAGPGTSLCMPSVLLPVSGTYRLEVEAASGQSGSYQVWVAMQSDQAPGRWLHPGDGSWHEASKWSGGVVPGSGVAVLIPDYPGTPTITVSQSNPSCASIVNHELLRLQASTLTVAGNIVANGGVTLAGGTLIGATVQPGAGGQGVTATSSGGTLNGVTLVAPVSIPAGASITSTNGLTLAGATITLGSAPVGHSHLYFSGTQTLGGSGEIVMQEHAVYTRYLALLGTGTSLTIVPGITVRGASGEFSATGAQNFYCLGTIRSEVAGRTITLQRVQNSGLISAINGSTIQFAGNWSNAGTISQIASTVNLGGNFTLSGFGSFTRSGGTVNLTGNLNLGGGTRTFDTTSGSWNFVGGTVQNGTLSGTSGQGLVATSSGGTLTNMTLAGAVLTIPAGTDVTATGGLTLAGGTVTMGSALNGHCYLYFNGTQTLGGTGEIVMLEHPVYTRYLWLLGATTALTIGSGVSVRGGDGQLNATTGQSFINQGTIRSDVATQVMTIERVQNAGLIDAVNGSTTTLAGAWASSGTISETNSTINLGGSFALASFGTFVRTGGTVNVTGTLDLGGGTRTFNAASGSWNLVGGAILNGTLSGTAGQGLIATGSGGTLTNMTLAGAVLTIPAASDVTSTSGLTLSGGTVTLGSAPNGHSYFYFNGTQTLGGTGEIVLLEHPVYTRYLWLQGATTALTIGSGVTVRGGDGQLNATTGQSFINQGTLRSDVATQAMTVQRVQNAGLIDAINGSTMNLADTWSSSGTISETNSTINLGGSFTLATFGTFVRSGGSVNVTGTFNLGGGTRAFDAATGSWNLVGGTIQGGTLSGAAGQGLIATGSGGTLASMTLAGASALSIPAASDIISTGGLTLSGATVTLGSAPNGHSYLYFSGTQTLGGTGEIVMLDHPVYTRYLWLQGASTALTIGPGVTVRGGDGQLNATTGQSFINQGTLRSDIATQAMTVQRVQNAGLIDAINGSTMNLADAWTSSGTISETNSTINLGGSFTLAAFGTFVRSGGSVNVTGTFNLGGGTRAFDAATGSWNLVGGTIQSGTLSGAAGQGLIATGSGGTLANMTLAGAFALSIPAASDLISTGGLTLSGATVTLGSAPNGHSYLYFSGTQTLGGTGEIVLLDHPVYTRYLWLQGASTALTIGPGVTVRGGDGQLTASTGQSFINQGTLRSDVATQAMTVQRVQNAGLIDAINGSTMNLADTWSSSGTISETNSTINLGGSFTLATFGTFVRSGGSVNVTGTFNLGGGTRAFDAATGSWNLVGGTIQSGTLSGAAGQGLIATGSGGTLASMTLAGASALSIPASSDVTSTGGLTLSGATVTLGSAPNGHSYLYFNGTQTLGGTGEIVLLDHPIYTRYLWLQGASTALTIGPGVTVRGGDAQLTASTGQSFINQGTIRSDIATQVMTIERLQNSGLVDAINGSTTTLTGPWSSSGTLSENASTLNLGGTFSLAGLGTITRTGGAINITGALDLGGGTRTFNAASGSWNLAGGTISNGTLSGATGQGLIATGSGGTLASMTLAGASALAIPSSADVTSTGGLTLSAATVTLGSAPTGHSYLYFSGTQTLGGTGEVVLLEHPIYTRYLWLQGASTALTIATGVTVRGADGQLSATTGQSFLNQGTVRSEVAGQSIAIANLTNAASGLLQLVNDGDMSSTGTFSNAGSVTIGASSAFTRTGAYTQTAGSTTLTSGTLSAVSNTIDLQGGVLAGNGTVIGAVLNAAQVAPGGGSLGDLSITGTYSQTSAGTLALNLNGTGAGQFDRLLVSGAATLAGTLQAAFGFTPSVGNMFTFLTYSSAGGTTFTTIAPTGLGGGQSAVVNYGGTSATLQVQ